MAVLQLWLSSQRARLSSNSFSIEISHPLYAVNHTKLLGTGLPKRLLIRRNFAQHRLLSAGHKQAPVVTIDLSFVHAATAHGSRAALVEDHPFVGVGVVMKPGALIKAGKTVGLKWNAVG